MLLLPPVQNAVIHRTARSVSKTLGTQVEVGRVTVRPFNRVVFHDIYVEDHQADTLLYAGEVEVNFFLRQLFGSGIVLGTVRLDGAQLNLRHTGEEGTNLGSVLDRLRKTDARGDKRPLNIRASSFRITDSRFSYRAAVPDGSPPPGIDFADMEISALELDVSDVAVLGDSVGLRINGLSLSEKSGFAVNSLSSRSLSVSSGGIFFDRLAMDTPQSHLEMPRFYISYTDWNAFEDFAEYASVDASLEDSRLALSTLGWFIPGLWGRQTVLEDLDANVTGPISGLQGALSALSTGNTAIALSFSANGLPDADRAAYTLDIDTLAAYAADLRLIIEDVTRKQFAAEIVDEFENLGLIGVRGRFAGDAKQLEADAAITSEKGSVDGTMHLYPAQEQGRTAFAGNVNVNEFDLGGLFGIDGLGYGEASASLEGSMGKGSLQASTNAVVAKVEYGGYTYSDVTLNGDMDNNLFRGNIGCSDPNLKFDFTGELDFNDSIPRYDFDMHLFNADLRALNINARDSVSLLQGDLKAVASGRTFDELNGALTLDNMVYVSHTDTVRTGRITITGDNDSHSKYLALRSSFADAEFRSRRSYNLLFDDVVRMMHNYMPMLSSGEIQQAGVQSAPGAAGEYSLLSVNVKEANNVAGIFVPGLMIASGTRLSLSFNPDGDQISLRASSDYVELGDNFISKMNINGRNEADSLSLYVHADELLAGGIYMPGFSVIGGAHENRINLTARFTDPEQGSSALVGIESVIERDTVSGTPRLRAAFTPSWLTAGDRTWGISGGGIEADASRVKVGEFAVTNGIESLTVSGAASRSNSDTLNIVLSNFDLAPFGGILSGAGYDFERGVTNGRADIVSAMHSPILSADVEISDVRISGVDIPVLKFESIWDLADERARFVLRERDSDVKVIDGYYQPVDGVYEAALVFEGMDLSLLEPHLDTFSADISGKADAYLTVRGRGRNPLFNGNIKLHNYAAEIEFLNVRYTVADREIEVKDNILSMMGAPLLDPYGNKTDFDVTVNLNNLKNVSYSVGLYPSDVLVLNTTERENELFYGQVYASGSAIINGDRRGVNMDINATTSDNSRFFMPLTSRSDMTTADFITFRSAGEEVADSSNYLYRRRLIFDRVGRQRRERRAPLNMNMVVDVLPNTDFQLLVDPKAGDILRARGNGSLNIHINPSNSEFTMYGDYELTEGTYLFTLQDVIARQFTIEQGSAIRWTGEPADAILDISAVYRVRASLDNLLGDQANQMTSEELSRYRRKVPVECRLILGDRLSHPSVSFNVTIPNVEPETQLLVANAMNTQESMATQFFYLLALSTFYNDAQGGIGSSAGSSIPLDFLANQISNIISTDKFNFGIRYRQADEYYSDEINIDFSTNLFSNRLILEIEGNYDSQNNPQAVPVNATSNLTGDFYLTWLIDKPGSLRAKVFSRTITRFDENQGLQENGIGLYYKEDFNNFGDIVRNFRSRFANWGSKKNAEDDEDEEDAPAGSAALTEEDDDQNDAAGGLPEDAGRADNGGEENK